METKEEILELLKNNSEELKHAQDTLRWLLILKPNADEILQISALGHDIERGITPWKNLKDIHTDEFREKHAERSAKIIKKILEKNNFNKKQIKRTYSLILKHEWGGNIEQNLLRDADSLANFEWCDDFFSIQDIGEIKLVAEKMYNRMSPERRKFIKSIKFKNKEIKNILEEKMSSQDQLVKSYLEKLNIKFKVHTHPAVFTCEEADKYCKNIPGIHSKNLLIKGKKTNKFYLVILPDIKRLDLKMLKQKFGEEFTFAKEDDLTSLLRIKTGAVSPFTLINDKDAKVGLLIDKEIKESNIVSFHPNINTETLELSQDDFQKYINSLKNKVETI